VRLFGSILTAIGVLIGVAVSLALLAGVTLPGVSFILAVGLVKLTYFTSLGFLGAGAIFHRLAKREEAARLLAAGTESDARPVGVAGTPDE
jgi:hypothetical protein